MGYAYRDRKKKKGLFRALWIQRINAGVRQYDMSYSEFIGKLDKKGITLNRKTLADLAMNHPEAFKAIVETVIYFEGTLQARSFGEVQYRFQCRDAQLWRLFFTFYMLFF